MKRLLQMSLDTLLVSVLPIIMWILLGIIVNKDISNVFSLTYPLQFFYLIFICLFAIGPNITAKKLNNKSIIFSNMIFGTLFVGIVTLLLVLNIDLYIELLHMNTKIYHDFCIYSVILFYFTFVLQMISQKLYYEDRNSKSNRINMWFNIVNFILIIILSITLNSKLSILITLFIDFIMLVVIFCSEFKITHFYLYLGQSIKYTSFKLLYNIGLFLTYGIGYGNSFSYGAEYAAAINFEGLTTDTQWDMLDSIDTASKIDFAENKFNYKESMKSAYQLLAVLIGTTLIMNITLYWYFKPHLGILLILLVIQIIDMLLDPFKTLRLSYLQINRSTNKHNIFYVISRIGRFLCSFIPSAFCTYIGQIFSMVYLHIYTKLACRNVKEFQK